MPESSRTQSYSIDAHDTVHVVEFAPFEWSSELIAFGTASRVTVGACRFQDEVADVEGMEFKPVRDFHHGSRVTAIGWAPDTSLVTIPKLLHFVTGGSDKKIRIFKSDLKLEHDVQEIEGHTDYINDVTFDFEKGEHIVSVSDDQTCRVWSKDGAEKSCLPLGAPGMSVRWHDDDPNKVMVAEKGGIIRFYNILTQQPIMSLDTGLAPLLGADWCHGNPLQVAALSGTDWVIFDTSRSSRPVERHQAHDSGGTRVRWCRIQDNLIATVSASGAQVRIFNTRTSQTIMSTEISIANSACWHYRLPVVAVGGDSKVHIWNVDTTG